MDRIKQDDGVDILSWCPNADENALEQMQNISKLPYVKYCAMMPDSHAGMSMPIGGVVATENVVVPNMVGVDIGCGMCAILTNLTVDDLTDSTKQILFNLISQAIPVGFSHNTDKRRKELENKYSGKYSYIVNKSNIAQCIDQHEPISDKAFFEQLGTLGGGNHFLEVQADEEDRIWIMIHSGSRNMGKKIGDYFNNLAKELNAKWFSQGSDIPFLPTDTPEGKAYLSWMDFALRFAFLNRQVMIDSVKEVFMNVFPEVFWITNTVVDNTVDDGMINIHHNFAALENHHGRNYWVHRKGATRAFAGMTGIIPGSMGTNSYIVKGLGNHFSLMSCSHGAGRKMGRIEFSKKMKYSHDQIEKSLEGVLHTNFSHFGRGKHKDLLDVSEAPGAYKAIDEVMANQEDLVRILVKLRPLISVKG